MTIPQRPNGLSVIESGGLWCAVQGEVGTGKVLGGERDRERERETGIEDEH